MSEPAPDPMIALARGLAVFPLPPGGKRPDPGWTRRVTTDPEVVAATWPAGANVGIGCRASGVVVLDLDRHPGGPDGVDSWITAFQRAGQSWPYSLIVRSPTGYTPERRGLHLYFRVPAGVVIGSTSGGVTALGPGIDTRGPGRRSGGPPVGPGSLFGGGRYEIALDAPIAELPDWLTELLTQPPVAPRAIG
jgi:Bifunctional DNA primase/polymerase, N-terminal